MSQIPLTRCVHKHGRMRQAGTLVDCVTANLLRRAQRGRVFATENQASHRPAEHFDNHSRFVETGTYSSSLPPKGKSGALHLQHGYRTREPALLAYQGPSHQVHWHPVWTIRAVPHTWDKDWRRSGQSTHSNLASCHGVSYITRMELALPHQAFQSQETVTNL